MVPPSMEEVNISFAVSQRVAGSVQVPERNRNTETDFPHHPCQPEPDRPDVSSQLLTSVRRYARTTRDALN